MNKKHSILVYTDKINKDSIIKKTSWKFYMHYVNTAFDFWLGLGKKGSGQYFRVGLIPWKTLYVKSVILI